MLICSAGPTGLTAKVEVARRGFKVTVFEARDAPSPLSCVVGINPESLHRLEFRRYRRAAGRGRHLYRSSSLSRRPV